MSLLTLILIIVSFISILVLIPVVRRKIYSFEKIIKKLSAIKSVGLFALIFGFLAQLIGLFSAFRAIKLEEVEVSPSLIAEGFKISMISAIYGILIFGFSMLTWFVLHRAVKTIEK